MNSVRTEAVKDAVPAKPAWDTPVAAAQSKVLALAAEALQIEADAILGLRQRLDASFFRAIEIMMHCRGRVVVSGMGKSGLIARKIAATLASTGTPSLYVHAGDASHGDLGMVTREDVFIALSNSGETEELLLIVPVVKRQGARLIAITGNPASTLAELAEVHLDAHVDKEACPLNLAPTASTTAALALGDALAVVLLDLRGFSSNDYARSHPGGSLGRRLLTHVRDVMRSGAAVPTVRMATPLTEALHEISQKGMGMTAVLDDGGAVAGVFTDGDLRRLIDEGHPLQGVVMQDVMHRNPHAIGPDKLAAEAADLMEQYRINQLLVLDRGGALVGALHIHDLTTSKVI
jgi:arabinose-5-phosphate isomerase